MQDTGFYKENISCSNGSKSNEQLFIWTKKRGSDGGHHFSNILYADGFKKSE